MRVSIKQAETSSSESGVQVELDMQWPPKTVKAPPKESPASPSFQERRLPEPVYFRNVDCISLPGFLSAGECQAIVQAALLQGFLPQTREGLQRVNICDLHDPLLAAALWDLCGLSWLLRTTTVDGMVPCGINEILRVQQYQRGGMYARHTDRSISRADGKVSKYSIRVFLNGSSGRLEPAEDGITATGGLGDFDGGLSTFFVPFQPEPVFFQPVAGTALLYPQAERCTVQEETQVNIGCKYVLRADVLFCRPDLLEARAGRA